jgi:hypothetical protein
MQAGRVCRLAQAIHSSSGLLLAQLNVSASRPAVRNRALKSRCPADVCAALLPSLLLICSTCDDCRMLALLYYRAAGSCRSYSCSSALITFGWVCTLWCLVMGVLRGDRMYM